MQKDILAAQKDRETALKDKATAENALEETFVRTRGLIVAGVLFHGACEYCRTANAPTLLQSLTCGINWRNPRRTSRF